MTTGYGYAAAVLLVSLDSAKGSTEAADIGHALDAAGNRVGETGPDGSQSFTMVRATG
ncbi:MAG: hypothetical protein QOF39_131 [Frankiales bacterium]|nr:hypothetical protein [Frankiales bacterium]